MTELASEMYAAWQGMTPLTFERLAALGAPRASIARTMSQCFPHAPVGVMRIEVGADGLWQPFDHGRPALVQPVAIRGEWGCDLVDLIAWRSSDPLKWYLRTGNAWALGLDQLEEVRLSWDEDPELRMHATPLDWLAAGGDGLVVLDWQSPELAELRLTPAIRAPSRDFAGMLRDALMRAPRLPTIRTERQGVPNAAAA